MTDYHTLPTGTDLDDLIGSYTLNDAVGQRCQQITAELMERIGQYETISGPYGAEILRPHLESISKDGAGFLKLLGVNDTACRNFHSAYLISDIGKLHPDFDQTDWLADKSTAGDKSDKRFRRLHTLKGIEILDQVLATEPSDVRTHTHWIVAKSLMAYHHECMDGNGEHKLPAGRMGQVLQVACIVDALDGDTRKRKHQTAGRTVGEALDRMQGINDPKEKYKGAFDPDLLTTYRAYKLPVPDHNAGRVAIPLAALVAL